MRSALAALLALLALAPACQEDGPSDPPVDDRPRGERCDDMQLCGRSECADEIAAVRDCSFSEDDCGFDPARINPLQEALAACLDDGGCNTTSCDLVGAFTDEPSNASKYCDDDSDAEVLNLARQSLFATDAVAECKALE